MSVQFGMAVFDNSFDESAELLYLFPESL